MLAVDRHRIETLVLFVLGVVAVWDGIRTARYYEGRLGAMEGGAYVALLGVLLAILAVTHGLKDRSTQPEPGTGPDPQKGLRWVLIAFGIFAGYILLIDPAGYLLATALFFTVYLRFFGHYRWAPILVVSIAVAVVASYGMAAIGIMLPLGVIPWP